ncbi:hypothetical protein K0M31_005887 [Melipona bicolor]|uniref:Uncharacterized protein n=1 Tax=Melipona bicolor TaxID=60889 RepID=A0AA40FUB0_9HYME|nr:hypothetical protein K0M31_005887 [Melipona bicolor]
MRWLLFAFVSLLSVAASSQNGVTRGGSGIQIGTSDRGSHAKGTGLLSGRGHSGVRLGEAKFPNSTRQRPFITTTTTPPPPPSKFTPAPQSGDNRNSYNTTYLRVGMMVPHKSFAVREYTKAVTSAVHTLQKSTRGPRLRLFQRFDIHVKVAMKSLTPSPTGESTFTFHFVSIFPTPRKTDRVGSIEPGSIFRCNLFYHEA